MSTNFQKQLPNIMTLSRFVMTPIIIYLLYLALYLPALILFVAASITDLLDGYFARKYGAISKLGAILDTMGDKILIVGVLIALMGMGWIGGLWVICVLIICWRELIISGLRESLAGTNAKLSVNQWGKWKAVSQDVAMVMFMLTPFGIAREYALAVLLFATIMTVISGAIYVKAAIDSFSELSK